MKLNADKSVNKLYGEIRTRYNDARANGYRLHTYFLREQEIIISELSNNTGITLDIACGSGLMTLPLKDKAELLLGLDFNEQACISAKCNSLNVIRGDAFSLPIGNESIDNALCCQFFNQQPSENLRKVLSESYRILAPGGKMILIWRNGEAMIHKLAHRLFKLYDHLSKQPSFPVVDHSIDEVENYAHKVGFETIRKEVIFPLLRWHTDKTNGLAAKLMGASNFLVLKHP